jgi:hypothetical protein
MRCLLRKPLFRIALGFLDCGMDEVKPGDFPSLPGRKFAASPLKRAIFDSARSLQIKPMARRWFRRRIRWACYNPITHNESLR